MKKRILITGFVSTLLFLGCAEQNVVKDKVLQKTPKSNDGYAILANKSIADCKTYDILLDEKRIHAFMRKSPQKTIDKALKDKEKTSKKLCLFFADETSVEKIEKAKEFSAKVLGKCKEVGVSLPKEKIHEKISNLPFFMIKKGLMINNKASVKECELMKKKYE